MYIYELYTATDRLDISRICNSTNLKITDALCTTAWKSTTHTMSVDVVGSRDKELYRQLVSFLLRSADENKRVSISVIDGSKMLFEGFVDISSLEIKSAKIPVNLSLSAKDNSIDLDNKTQKNFTAENVLVRTLVLQLLKWAEVIHDGDLLGRDDTLDTDTVDYFVITDDDSKTYRQIIDLMLFEKGGYVLYHNIPTGKYEIRKVLKTQEQQEYRKVNYLMSKGLNSSYKDFVEDGIAIKYPTVAVTEKTLVYTESISNSYNEETKKYEGITIQPKTFYPENGEKKATYQNFKKDLLDKPYKQGTSSLQNSDLDLLYVKEQDFKLEITVTEGDDKKLTQPAVDLIKKPEGLQLYPRKAWLLLYNDSDKPVNIAGLGMRGTAVYKKAKNTLVSPTDCYNPKEYETSYIFTEEQAAVFAKFYYNYLRLSQGTTSWSEKESISSIGEVVLVKHPNTDIVQKYVIVSIEKESVGTVAKYNIVAVSCSEFDLKGYKIDSEVYGDKYVQGPQGEKGDKGDKGEDGNAGTNGLNGWSQATIQLFQRKATKPTERPLQLNYTFKTGALSSGVEGKDLLTCLNGWSTTIPSGSDPLYVIYASAFNDTAVDPIDPNDWTPAEILSENGTKGENGFTVANIVLYKRFDSIPLTPTHDVTYNFYVGTIEGVDIGEGKWDKIFPPDNGQPLWVTNATASTRLKGVDDKDVITPQEWSTPQIIVKDGAKGDKGDKGEKGDTGSTGPKGDDGLKGDKGDKGEDGKDAITTYIDVSSYIFPALDNGIISPLEYEKFKSTVMVVQGEYRLTAINSSEALANNQFYLSASGNGITNLSIEKSMVRATKESVMIYNTASIDVTIHYRDVNGKTGTIDYKISLAKAIKGEQGITGDNGVGVKAIITYYGLSTSNTTAPTEWQSTSVPTMTATNKYLWSYQRIEYTDSTFLETGKIVTGVYGDKGETGNGIASIAYYYAVSTSQTAPSTITSTSIPTMSETNKYLWQKTVINFTNGTNKTEVALIGVYGETGKTGLTGQYTAFQYYASTSSTEQVGGSWSSTMPSIAGGKFLFMRTQVVPAGGTLGSNWSTPTLAGSDISKLMATIETVDGKVKQNTASINANAKAIATKVTQVEVDATVNKVQVGGRNLIRGTADQRSGDCGVFKYDNSYFNNDIKYGKADTYKSQTPWMGCYYDFYSLYKRENLKVGDVVTFSIRVLANFTPKKAVHMTLYRIGSTQDGQNNVTKTLGTKNLEPNKWYTYSATWAITQANLDIVQGNATSNINYPRAEVDYYDPDIYAEHKTYTFGEGNYIYIGGMKLEKGNIATDWTPAPEDLEQEINDNKTKLTEHETLIQQNADNIKLMVKKTDYATDQQGVTNKLNEQQSQIEQNALAITSKVSQTDYATDKGKIESSIKQTADSIALKVVTGQGGKKDIEMAGKAGVYIGVIDDQGYIKLDADKVILPNTLSADKIKANTLTVTEAQIKGDISASKIKLNDGQRGLFLSPDVIRCFNENGEFAWRLTADGNAYFKNATLDGKIKANSIESGALTTYDQKNATRCAVALSANYYRGDSLVNAVIAKYGSSNIYPGMIDVSGKNILYRSKKVKKIGVSTPDKYSSGTSLADSGDTLGFGSYYTETGVSAGSSYHTFVRKKNKTGKPMYVNANTILSGNMNDCNLWIQRSGYADASFKSANFWLLPDFDLYGSAKSWALWGNRTCYTSVNTYFSNGTCPSDWLYVHNSGGGQVETQDIRELVVSSITIANDVNYVWFHAVVYEVDSYSNGFSIRLKYGNTYIDSYKNPYVNSFWFDVSSYKGKTLTVVIRGVPAVHTRNEQDDEGNNNEVTYFSFSYNFNYTYFLMYPSDQSQSGHYGLEIVTTDNSCYFISSAGNNGYNEVVRYEDKTLGIDSNSFLSRIANRAFINQMSNVGINSNVKISPTKVGSDNYSFLYRNGTRYPNANTSALNQLEFYSSFVRFYYNNNTDYVDLYFKDMFDFENDLNSDYYSNSLNCDLQPLAQDERCETASMIPKQSGIYNLGDENYKYKKLWLTQNLYLGTKSFSGDGYTFLPNGFILQWMTVRTNVYGKGNQTIQYPIPFPNAALSIAIGYGYNHSPERSVGIIDKTKFNHWASDFDEYTYVWIIGY